MTTDLTEVERVIAFLRGKREKAIGSKAKELDRQIAVLIKAWKNCGGKFKIAGETE